jgi:drug/metabolite transporter (DMT)-like permease
MKMQQYNPFMNILMFGILTLIWGSTWLGIKMQLGTVPVMWSLIYRFGFSSLLFFSFCLLQRYPLRLSRNQHLFIALLGVLMFSVNYILLYVGSQYLISGLVAITGALLTIMNVFNSRFLLKTELNPRVIVGSLLGLVGLATIFISTIDFSRQVYFVTAMLGFTVCLLGAYVASCGNILAAYNNRKYKIPVVTVNAYGMLYGTLFTLLLAIVTRQPFVFDPSIKYMGSLLFLSLFGSVFAFQIYLVLLERIGPERVGYVFIITPVIALLISSFFENFIWTWQVILGIGLVLIGNAIVLFKPEEYKSEPNHQIKVAE